MINLGQLEDSTKIIQRSPPLALALECWKKGHCSAQLIIMIIEMKQAMEKHIFSLRSATRNLRETHADKSPKYLVRPTR